MARKVIGSKGSRRRRRFLLAPIVMIVFAVLYFTAGAQAVHDEAVFQLDGNASTALQSSPSALEDWDLICKANQVSIGTLAANITATATSITVTETQTPHIVPFNIQIGSEQMTVTARTAGTPATYTVTRGFNGTTAAAASSGASVISGCLFNPGYAIPSGTTVSSPNTFIVDPSQSATDDILKGGTKDDNNINTWSWTSAKPSPPKNDLTDGYAAEYTCKGAAPNSVSGCQGTTGDKLLYFGADRFSISGVANVAFWFFQGTVKQNSNTDNGQCSVSSGCNFVDQNGNPATHTVGNISLGGTTPGDILIISAFGPHSLINVYEWVGAGNATKNYLGTNSCFTAACSLQPLAVGGQACGTTPSDNACAIANSTAATSPWPLPQENGTNNVFAVDTVHASSAFFEGGLNLTGLGLGGACFSSFLINSRASAAGDAELHDKILGQFARCGASLKTQASKTSFEIGGSLTDAATVTISGSTTPPTGIVSFFVCGPPATSCATTGTAFDTKNLSGASVSGSDYTVTSASFTPTSAGTYCFAASWPGDSNYKRTGGFRDDGSNECFTVTPKQPGIVTHAASGTGIVGTAIDDKATLSNTATPSNGTQGTITFTVYGPFADTTTCTGTPLATSVVTVSGNGDYLASSGTITGTLTTSKPGTYNWIADYKPAAGDVNNKEATTACGDANEASVITGNAHLSTAQDWLPNDTATLTGDTNLNGALTFTLFNDLTCGQSGGTSQYTKTVTVTDATSGATFSTDNTTHKVTATGNWSWLVHYADNNLTSPSDKCETTAVTITN